MILRYICAEYSPNEQIMKKLILILLSLITAGSLFQACDDTKTYAEMLEEEKDAVNKFINDNDIRIISLEGFERDTVTTSKEAGDAYDEYVAFSNGVYMQIVKRGGEDVAETDTFANYNEICARYVEVDMLTNDTTCFNVALEGYMDATQFYAYPLVFRYVVSGSTAYGTIIEQDYYWSYLYASTVLPSGWLLALPYLRNGGSVRLIVPSKMGHTSAQQYVTPFFYDIWGFKKSKS